MTTTTEGAPLTSAVLLGGASSASASTLNRLYVFGDSYSDSGNGYVLEGGTNPPSPPYNRQFSNGPTAVQYIAQNLGIKLTYSEDPAAGNTSLNFAVSGAWTGTKNDDAIISGTTGMLNQVADFQGRVSSGAVAFDPSSSLAVLFGGINDVLFGNSSGETSSQIVSDAVSNIRSEVTTLTGLGVKYVAVATIPEIGRTPVGPQTGQVALLDSVSDALNTAYEALIPQLDASTGADVFRLDWGSTFDQLVADPSAFGLSNSTDPYLTGLVPKQGADPSQYVFFDSLHPTTAAHQVIGNLLTAEITANVSEPASASPGYPPTIVVGAGKSTLALQISEDAYLGDAQFTIGVDGSQVGGTQTATALHGSGSTQAFDVLGDFSTGSHQVTVNFLNDFYAGTPATDRNLYVQSATIDNTAVAASQLTELSAGPQSVTFQGSAQPDTLTVGVSEDGYEGDAQYYILVDGYIAGYGAYTATASHAAGQVNLQTVTGSWGNGAHTIGLAFLNDFSDAGGDRNLYINSINYNGIAVAMGTTEQASNGTANFEVAATPAETNLTLHLAEDAYLGDAQFTVAIDGKQIGGVGTVSALNSAGATQAFNFSAVLAAGAHDVGVTFTNGLYGGSYNADRALYVRGADLDGTALSATSWSAAMPSNGTDHFALVVPS